MFVSQEGVHRSIEPGTSNRKSGDFPGFDMDTAGLVTYSWWSEDYLTLLGMLTFFGNSYIWLLWWVGGSNNIIYQPTHDPRCPLAVSFCAHDPWFSMAVAKRITGGKSCLWRVSPDFGCHHHEGSLVFLILKRPAKTGMSSHPHHKHDQAPPVCWISPKIEIPVIHSNTRLAIRCRSQSLHFIIIISISIMIYLP